MGDDTSKPAQNQDDFFLLEHSSKMSLKNHKIVSYYLISSQTGPSLPPLRQYFKIDTFPSVTTLKQEMSFVGKDEVVKVIITDSVPPNEITYLQSQPKIHQIISYNSSATGGKIGGNAKTTMQLITLLNTLEEKDALEIPPTNILFTTDQDIRKLNHYRLNYHCNTLYNDRSAAKKDFVTLARKLYPHQEKQIASFEKSYDLELKGAEKRKMVIEWAFKGNFYWEMLHQLSRNTNDPKRLAYLRLPIKDLYETIYQEFKADKKYETFYIVAELTEEEKSKLQKSKGTNLIFTSFVKGFVGEKEAIKQKKSKPNSILFVVESFRAQRNDKLDFGYVRFENQLLVNIYNVMKVQEVNMKTRSGQLVIGVLPAMDVRRMDPEERPHMLKGDLDLTRNYDFLEDLMGKVDGQATLLQFSGYYKDSIDIYDKKVDFIRKTNESEEVMNRCLIRKADALALTGDFSAAEKAYQSVNSSSQTIKVIALIHLADMYMRMNEQAKLEKVTLQIEPMLSVLDKNQKEKEQFYKGKHFLAIKTLKKGSHKKATEELKKLVGNISSTYTHNFEGKPLYHDITRTMAACEFKAGRPKAALEALNQTLKYQLACEGKTHNVAMTETLIQSVCHSSGAEYKEQLQQSEQRLKEMSNEIDSNQSRLSPASVTNLNSSVIAINM